MNIYYNGAERENGILTFSDVPNILQVKETISGRKSQLKLQIDPDFKYDVEYNNQFYITLFGEAITNVMSAEDANNKRFYVGRYLQDTTISMVKAFRNCSALNAEFIITTESTDNPDDTVVITARNIGYHDFQANFSTNIPLDSDIYVTIVNNGGADDDTNKLFNSKIDVDVYKNNEYITTLEKNFYNNECSFDVSPVLATMTEPVRENEPIEQYTLYINRLADDGSYNSLGTVSGLTTYGYLANQSQKYLPLTVQLLSNNKTTDRGGIVYTYDSTIKYSVLARPDNSGGFSITYTVRNSSMDSIYSTTVSYNTPTGSAFVKDIEWTVPNWAWSNAYYVEVQYLNDIIRFNVIRPLKAAEDYQRIYWRNTYGGLSFFDFTGQRTETDSIEIETYEKGIFDYYNSEEFERKKIYSNKPEKTVKVKSHLMEENGKYIFNEMIRSKKMWTVINDKVHYIIPKSVEVTEDSTYNGIYTATFTYTYSDLS